MKNKSKLMKNKSQLWGIDLMIAVTLFVFGIMIFYIYNLNAPSDVRENFEYMYYDGDLIMNSILSEGYPTDWNTHTEDLVKIGILTDGKINNTKLQAFNDLVDTEPKYKISKTNFSTKYDYYFYLDSTMESIGAGHDGIGKPGVARDPITITSRNLIKITRFTIYENKPMTAYLYVWE